MPGIIAESHYDGGRNFIFMARGRKRYILSRPEECDKLEMLMNGPSARHSKVDWTNVEGMTQLSNASALQVIIEAGDALYVPAHWYVIFKEKKNC
jgi:ribosomal protein L16 Arg81 hydroxylase